MDDQRIISLLWQRSEEGISAAQERYGHRLQRLAGNILIDPQDVEECLSDTYLALWNTIPPKRPEPLGPYVLRLCKNIAVSRLRKNLAAKRCGYEQALEELANALGGPTPEQITAERELGRAIDAFLDTLPEENRVIFLRRYWFGDGVKDIAALTGLSENTVSVRLNRIRHKLRTYLEKEGLL